MPALFFPNLDALRLAVVSGLVPAALAMAPAGVGVDAQGRLWLETEELPSRESLSALARFGIQVSSTPGITTRPVSCWAEILPLRRVDADPQGAVLFDVPDRHLAVFAARLQRLHGGPVGVRLLAEPHAGRAWVAAHPPPGVVAWLEDPELAVRAYRQQSPHVWVARGYEHPLAEHLNVPEGRVVLCDPARGALWFDGPVPPARQDELPLPPQPVKPAAPRIAPRVEVHFRLKRCDDVREETFWVLTPPEQEAFRAFCQRADERLLRRFQVALVGTGDESRLLIRRADADDSAGQAPVLARGFHPDPRLPWLFIPTGHVLRPLTRVHELARELARGENRLVWVEGADRGIVTHAVPGSAFRPLSEQVEYVGPQRVALEPELAPEELFPFARFALQVETSIDLEPEPRPAERVAVEPLTPKEDEPGWISKSVARMLSWVRGAARPGADPPSAEPAEADPPERRPAPALGQHDERVERKLASPDALLHGHDWAARRHELESRLLADFPRLGPEDRAARWAELASVYAATGQSQDAAVCWANALWECAAPPEAWLEQWAVAECRAAKRSERAGDLERWLGEPGRPGAGRVIAALAGFYGFRASPPAEFVAALPRVLAILEQQFDDIPVRGAWLARLAIARSCDGDTLGVARWRDRLVRRLHDRGPGLDLDEPSFLRFRGRATAERFKVAREWLIRAHAPVRAWAERPAGISGLQAVGLAAETKATVEYAQLMLAWGLGVLGERARSRDWAARARKALSSASGPRADPAGHAFLGDLFLHRVKEAHEGHVPKPGLPAEFQERLDRLPEFARYSIDRLREHSRILQPVGLVRAYRGRELREFWGADLFGERLSLLGSLTDPAQINDEARAILGEAARPSTSTVPRAAFALLEVATHLEPAQLDALLELVPTAIDWIETWVQACRWADGERADRISRFRSRMVENALAVAPAPVAERLMLYLIRAAAAGRMLPAILAAAPRVFRAARRFDLTAAADALIQILDPARAEWAEPPIAAEQAGLATGWFVAGNEEVGHRILNAARQSLFNSAADDLPRRTALAVAYAESLGFAPASIALGRLEEIFQRLDRVTVHCSSNCYFTLQPLRLIDTVVRSVVTDDFTLSPTVRAWMDEDEFLIRRRIHRDMGELLREDRDGAP